MRIPKILKAIPKVIPKILRFIPNRRNTLLRLMKSFNVDPTIIKLVEQYPPGLPFRPDLVVLLTVARLAVKQTDNKTDDRVLDIITKAWNHGLKESLQTKDL
jgi:hypothetical protein